jgi:hypothetical protein
MKEIVLKLSEAENVLREWFEAALLNKSNFC